MFRFLNLLLLLSFFPTLYSTEIITLEPGTKKINLGKLVYYYEDQKNELTFDTVSSLEFEKKFIQNHTEIFSFGFNPYTYWLRLDFENLDSKEMNWLLEIGYSHLDTIDFYFQKDNVWQKQKYGDLLPFSKREIFSRFFVIPIEISKQVKNRLYIKIKTSTVVIVPLNLYKPTTYIESNMKQEGWYAFFYGAMFVMILYNGFVYLAFRDNSYLLYCLSTFFTLFFYLSFNGHGFQYLWKENIWLQNHSVPIFTGIAWICALAFTNLFLELKKNFKYLNYICIILQSVYFISLIVIFNSIRISIIIQTFVSITTVIFILFSGIKSLLHGNKSARYYLIAWFTFLIGVILFLLYILNLIERNFITEQTMQIGSLAELVLLSFALADRYHLIQDNSIKVHKELLDTQRRINETLEEKVIARTTELNTSLNIIKDDLMMAKKIQSLTLASNLNQNEKLEIVVRYIAMSEVGGDYYSVDKLDDSIVRIFLADATGHGVQAALIMMAIQGIYDTLKYFALPVHEIMEIFNKEFIRRYGSINTYLTCILVDIDTSKHKLTFTSAGHPEGLLIRKDKNINLLENTGRLIGIDRKYTYLFKEYPFTEGDRLFIFTDGIFEQFIGEQDFGEKRLHNILIQNQANTIDYSLENVLSELESFLDGMGKQDDITLLGIGYK